MSNYLYKEFEIMRKHNHVVKVPSYVKNNLSNKIELRDYQEEAIENFIMYVEDKTFNFDNQKNLLFHMATGSGKTVIMAALILYLAKKGYNNFLFFVNSTNILEKTIDNFINSSFSKYLFSNSIEINGKKYSINKVDNFQYQDNDSINISFTTVQGLHYDLWNPSENSITIEDFEEKSIVLISDEAHHINADTSKGKLSKTEIEENRSWEQTVNRIFFSDKRNLLLEFTATLDLRNDYIKQKYEDKIIFDYPLSKFRESRYTKELSNLQSDLNPWERTLQAIILSLYREKLFNMSSINIKPVILLKSQKIIESKSFYNEFHEKLKNLNSDYMDSFMMKISSNPLFSRITSFFSNNNIDSNQLVNEIKLNFSIDKSIIMNSKDDMSSSKQKLVNTLEDLDNPYRLIFTVEMLNEGWDVLNLFDIVRLYETRQGGPGGSISKFTIREAQLIGRGARYCPFTLKNYNDRFRRKFDDDLDNDYRICETLFFHSKQDSRYIEELRRALKETGLLSDKRIDVTYKIKEEFKKSKVYKDTIIFANNREPIKRSKVDGVSERLRSASVEYYAPTGKSFSLQFFSSGDTNQKTERTTKIYYLKDIDYRISHKAIRNYKILRFSNIKSIFPYLSSIKEFLKSEKYLGSNIVKIIKNKSDDIVNEDIYIALLNLFEKVSQFMSNYESSFIGTLEFYPKYLHEVFTDKKRLIEIKNDNGEGISQNDVFINPKYRLDLSLEDWYVYNDNYGTTEEKLFIKYFKDLVPKLNALYDNVFLIRNERQLKVFSFESGEGFEPDYVLILNKNEDLESRQIQVFIEPKGEHLLGKDQWKNDFLINLKKQAIPVIKFSENREFIIWGLPLYNQKHTQKIFDDEVKKLLS